MKPDVIHPRVISLFLQATPQYRAQQVIGRVQKTPTLARLYFQEGAKDLYRLLEHSEFQHFKSVLRQSCGTIGRLNNYPDECAVDIATKLRKTGWKKIIKGVDCVPPHEMFQLEIMQGNNQCSPQHEIDKGFIAIRVCCSPRFAPDPLVIGPSKPYRGSFTKNKVASVSTRIQARTPSLLQRALIVAGLESWAFEPESSLAKLARGLVMSLTDLPYDLLTPQIEQVTGSHHHRLRNERLEYGGVSPVLPNQGTKIQFNTVPLICLSKGSKNKNVMFQGPLVLMSTILGEGFINREIVCPPSQLIHIHVSDSRSMKDLDEDQIVYPPLQETLYLCLETLTHLFFILNKKRFSHISDGC